MFTEREVALAHYKESGSEPTAFIDDGAYAVPFVMNRRLGEYERQIQDCMFPLLCPVEEEVVVAGRELLSGAHGLVPIGNVLSEDPIWKLLLIDSEPFTSLNNTFAEVVGRELNLSGSHVWHTIFESYAIRSVYTPESLWREDKGQFLVTSGPQYGVSNTVRAWELFWDRFLRFVLQEFAIQGKKCSVNMDYIEVLGPIVSPYGFLLALNNLKGEFLAKRS